MNKIITIISISLGVLFLAGCGNQEISTPQPAQNYPVTPPQPIDNQESGCKPNYVLNDDHKLIPNRQTNPKDMEIIQKFNVKKECSGGNEIRELWIQEAQKNTTDSPFEKIMYCESENKFLVIKSSGINGAAFYLYEGKPCK